MTILKLLFFGSVIQFSFPIRPSGTFPIKNGEGIRIESVIAQTEYFTGHFLPHFLWGLETGCFCVKRGHDVLKALTDAATAAEGESSLFLRFES